MPAKTARKPRRWSRPIGLRLIIGGTAGLLVAAGLVGAGMLADLQSRASLNAELRTRLLLGARHLALAGTDALRSRAPELILQPFIGELQKDDPALVLAVIVDPRGTIQGHSDRRRLGERYAPPETLKAVAGFEALRAGESLAAGPTLLVAESPVLDPAGDRIGRAMLAMRRDIVGERARAALPERLLILGLFLLLIMAASAAFLLRFFRPLAPLRAGMDRIRRGSYEASLPVAGCVEVAALAEAFNAMAAQLHALQLEKGEPGRAAPAAPVAALQDALRRLARAQKEGKRLSLPASIEALGELRGWVRASLELAGLSSSQVANLVDTVHAAAAAVAEKAYDLDAKQRLELWWLGPGVPGAGDTDGASGNEDCCFLLRDKGRPGKSQKGYFPGTEAGNLTLIAVAVAPQPAAPAPALQR